MATSKDLAESYFQQAVNLEKVERKKRVQNFDKIFKLYEEVIQIDPNHGGALNNLAYLYLERPSDDLDEIEKDRAGAKAYYEKAVELRQTGAKHNLRLLNLVNASEKIKDFECEGRAAEDGRYNRGRPNPCVAISMYKEAEAHYDEYIPLLEAEYTRIQAIKPTMPSAQFVLYKRMIAYNKQFAEKGRARLQDMCIRNEFYREGLRCEETIGDDGHPDYAGAIEAYQKAKVLGHVAAGIRHADLLSRSEKTKDTIDQDKENDPNGIFTHMPAITTQKTIGPGSVVSKRNVLFPIQRPLEGSLKEKKMLPSIVNSVRATN